ncbi:MAG: carboxylesterase family protein, partial [Chloroflexota bacterium]
IDFAKRAGAAGPNQIKQLRQMSAEDLQKIVKEGYASAGNFYPVVDGHYLPKSTFETFQDGDHANVPLIIGNNDDEFSFFHSVLPMPLLEYAEVDQPTDRLPDYMTDEYGEDVERLKELYPGLETLDSVAVARFQGDYFFCAASRFYVGEMAHEDLDTTAPVYYYRFRRKSPLEGEVGGAFHAADLPFVFGALHSPVFASDEADNELAEIMQSYWTNFAKTGNPNGPSLPEWDTFSADGDPQWMILDRDTVGMQAIDLEENFEILTARIQRTIDTVRKEDSLLHTQSSVA